MAMTLPRNMGAADRILRTGLGFMLLLNGLMNIRKSMFRSIESIIGGLFLLYGVTGFDPLLALAKTNTRFGDETNIFNLSKQALPGHGDRPRRVEQPVPRNISSQFALGEKTTIGGF